MITLNRSSALAVAVAAAFVLAGPVQAAAPVIYPAKGQGPQQQQKDDGECYVWAKNNTGIDPAKIAGAPPPPSGPAVGGGQRVAGALGGAAVGALIGGDSHGAAVGAGVGMMAGGAKARQKQQAQQQSAQAQKQGALDTFYRAYGACMEGRGYTVR
jgi:hypothetical protein